MGGGGGGGGGGERGEWGGEEVGVRGEREMAEHMTISLQMERDAVITANDNQLKAKDRMIAAKEKFIVDRESEISQKDQKLVTLQQKYGSLQTQLETAQRRMLSLEVSDFTCFYITRQYIGCVVHTAEVAASGDLQ